jgi:hypothetical protein
VVALGGGVGVVLMTRCPSVVIVEVACGASS